MSYIFKGNLCGRLCSNCEEDLSNVQVKLYRLRKDQRETVLATANPKNTFAILSEKEITAKEEWLIDETQTGDDGSFQFELSDDQKYDGEAFEIDVYIEKAPGQEERPENAEPVQFTITTHQPQWKKAEEGVIAAWEHCISHRFWCKIRELLGAYVICGQVVDCETEKPLSNQEVFAFDADWIEDDELGSDITDSNGQFRIYYSRSDFEKTPLSPIIDIELIGGPDLYFKIASGGSFVFEEPREKGREPERENASACFCVELCSPSGEAPPPDPLFTNVGDFHILNDIDSGNGLTNKEVSGIEGLHGGPGFGFYGSLKLYGYCPKRFPDDSGELMRYRFLYEDLDNNPGNEKPLTGNLVKKIRIGSRWIQWDLDGSGPQWTFQDVYVSGSGATPDPTPTPSVPPGTPWGPVPDHVIVPDDTEGWIEVDDNAVGGGFHTLLGFNTREIASWSPVPDNGAGNEVTNPRDGIRIKLIFEAEPVTGATSTNSFRDEVPKMMINNFGEVRELNLEQFTGPGADSCTPLSDALNILYTTDHELMRSWGLGISSAALGSGDVPTLPSNIDSSGGTNTVRGGYGNKFIDISSWPSCSYTVSLSTRRKLTDGEEDANERTTRLTFCK